LERLKNKWNSFLPSSSSSPLLYNIPKMMTPARSIRFSLSLESQFSLSFFLKREFLSFFFPWKYYYDFPAVAWGGGGTGKYTKRRRRKDNKFFGGSKTCWPHPRAEILKKLFFNFMQQHGGHAPESSSSPPIVSLMITTRTPSVCVLFISVV
jgi:hypothetical protein